MHNAENEHFVVVEVIKEQMLGKSRDCCPSYVAKCWRSEFAGRAAGGSGQQVRNSCRDSFLPTLSQWFSRPSGVPLSLFQYVGNRRVAEDKPTPSHRLRARARSAEIRPLRRISASGISIFGPLAAATSSCSRLPRRRSLSWRISSRTYSLGVPQSPVATCPSTYFLRASGREMFREVIGIAS